jgi:Rne/Rng family ribonuclease
MSKELFISSSPHETKIAVMEDDNLVEVFYQRDTDVGLVGGIYKGRVSRVLPGMQSAFVDIGLERDAFLYVSDFFEDSDEYDRVASEAEARVGKYTAPEPASSTSSESASGTTGSNLDPTVVPPDVEASSSAAEPDSRTTESPTAALASPPPPTNERAAGPVPTSDGQTPSRWEESRGRSRRRRRGRGFGGKYEVREHRGPEHRPAESAPGSGGIELLPGESLAKYAHLHPQTSSSAHEEAGWRGAPAVDLTAAGVAGTPTAETSDSKPFPSPASSASEEQGAPGSAAAPACTLNPLPSFRPIAASARSSVEASSEYRIEEELLAGNLRLASVPEPDAPKHVPAKTGEQAPGGEPAGESRGASETDEAVFTSSASSEAAETDTFESAGRESDAIEEDAEAEPEADVEVENRSIEAEDELTEDGGGAAQGPAEPVLAPADSASAVPADRPAESAGESGDRFYTLRDSNQRPRFAPRRGRRGRGRFGRRGVRPEGQPPRRPDHSRGGNEQAVQINEILKEGQEILVQIAKEPLGTKGARITSHIALPGRYLVYMPTIHHLGVSRKIASEEERLRLRNLILEHRGSLTGGIIVRTAAAGRSDDELKADVDFLARLWNEIRSRSEHSKAPALIHRDLTLVERILRDILSPDFKSVRVDNELEYQNVLDFVDRFQPSLVGHVKLYTKETPIFEEFGIQGEIDKALKPKVWLKSGGYIVINQTEALVAIDVNTGKYVGRTNRLEDTIVKTNIDAVKEIVRQIRLRDLGGIVVIDFIDMDDRRNRMKVVQALEEALRSDRAPTKILSFNEFGLVALTRKRVKQSLERTLSEPCPYCSGSGWIKSVTTICYEILEEARKMAQEIDGDVLTLRVNPEIARALKSREGTLTAELESLTGKDVIIKSDPSVHQERFEIF